MYSFVYAMYLRTEVEENVTGYVRKGAPLNTLLCKDHEYIKKQK